MPQQPQDANASAATSSLAAITEAGALVGNPASAHQFGQAARRQVDAALRHLAELACMPGGRVVLTGSAWEAHCLGLGALGQDAARPTLGFLGHRPTKACNLASALGLHIAAEAVLSASDGAQATCATRWLLTAADPTTGALAPLHALDAWAHENNVPYVLSWGLASPMAQSLGHGLRPTAIILDGPALGLPGPAAALVLAPGRTAPGLWVAGGQQEGSRPGTVPRDVAAGMGAAAAWARHHASVWPQVAQARDALDAWAQALQIAQVVKPAGPRLAHLCCWQVPQGSALPLRRHLRRFGLHAQIEHMAAERVLLTLVLAPDDGQRVAACVADRVHRLVGGASLCAQERP